MYLESVEIASKPGAARVGQNAAAQAHSAGRLEALGAQP
jgi:hypothetical protein